MHRRITIILFMVKLTIPIAITMFLIAVPIINTAFHRLEANHQLKLLGLIRIEAR